MLLFDVTAEFDRQLKGFIGHKPNVYQFLKNHERRTLVLNNLCHQVLVYERKFKTKLDRHQRNKIIGEAVKIFCHVALKQRHQQLMSDIQRHQVAQGNEAQNQTKDEMKEILVEVPDEKRSPA
jgi:hypothetical protein